MRGWSLFLCTWSIVFGLSSCAWIGKDALVEDDAIYREGLQATKDKDYDEAVASLRKIPPNSPFYRKALQLIRKIPLLRVQDAIDERNYRMALNELHKIPPTHESYPEVEQLKMDIAYHMALEEYQKARNFRERVVALEKLSLAVTGRQIKERLIEAVEIIGGELNQSTQTQEIETFLALLETTLLEQRDPDVLYAGLGQSFEAYDQFHGNLLFRSQLLRLIAQLKLRL